VTRRPTGGLARGPALAVAVAAFTALVVVAALLVPWDWVPGGRLVPARVSSLFSAEQVARAERHAWWQRGLGWPAYALSIAVVVAVALSGRGRRLTARVVGHRRWWLAVPLVVLTVLVLQRLVTLPFAAAAHAVDRADGLTRQGYAGWLRDVATSVLVSWVGTSLVLLALVGWARRSPRWWFAGAGATAAALVFAGSFLYPVLVEPLFNSFTPMPNGPLKQSILRLAEREGVRVDDVLVADASRRTTTLNAYVSGFGGSRRVVVYDNLVEDLPRAQARVVIAHELGHARHDDVLLGTTLGALGSVGAVALLALLLESDRFRRRVGSGGAADPASVAAILALVAVGTFLVSPAQNTVSRAIEARADRASLAATHAGPTFVRMQRRLALTSLQDPTPPALSQFWWGSHPTVLQRAGLPASLRRADR
jgi:STE24 endopeptidase